MAINVKVTLDDPFVMLSEDVIAQTTSSGSTTTTTSDDDGVLKVKKAVPTAGTGYEIKEQDGKICSRSFSFTALDCIGSGSIPCTPYYQKFGFGSWECE